MRVRDTIRQLPGTPGGGYSGQDGPAEGGDEVAVGGAADGSLREPPPELAGDRLRRPGAITDAATSLAAHPSARYVSTTAGRSCVVHQGVVRDERGLADFLTHDLARLPGVTSFDVSIVLEALRRHRLDREDGRLADATGRRGALTVLALGRARWCYSTSMP